MQSPTGPLVSVAWLVEHVADADLAVLDATARLDTASSPGTPYDVRSGRPEWEVAHVPGARFADLVGVLSDPAAPFPFTLPSPGRFAAGMAALGVGDETLVVTYDNDSGSWATRLWWMLRVFGHDRVAVLDGGLAAWTAAGLTVTDAAPAPVADASFTPRFRPDLLAERDEVLAALEDPSVLLVNALSPGSHAGADVRYGRAGHIPGSVNVWAGSLREPDGRFRATGALREEFGASRALEADRVIAYCGGGISATSDALALALLGRDDVAIYDGSLREWAADPELPLESG